MDKGRKEHQLTRPECARESAVSDRQLQNKRESQLSICAAPVIMFLT